MPYKNITLTLPAELLPIINEAAKANYCTRSDYIREAVMLRLRDQRVVKRAEEPNATEEKQNGFDLWSPIC
ncbi:MAG: hypothetical protein JWO35_544 [Candidatus Saccharibacteria bacterium]|nr:hypothetical protein [Candidatus Saccharibacteria bacterium]